MDKLNGLILSLGICLCILMSTGCKDVTEPDPIPPSEFSKNYREQLGDKIEIAIAFQQDAYPILPNIPPYDTTVYAFIQTLYDQVTFAMKIDHQSPTNDRWDPDRNWRVNIIESIDKNAFIIPGGHLYLTTGLLRHLKTEHELYYFLAFEATLMNEKFLLENLITTHNTNNLASIANGTPSPGGLTSQSLADDMAQLTFAEDIVKDVDELTAELICGTSIMRRTGLLRLLEATDDNLIWLTTRSTYPDRTNHIEVTLSESIRDCGNFETDGGYQRYVLDWLE